MSLDPHRNVRRAVALALLLAAAGCSRRAPVPEPGQARTTPPDLRGSRVMVLPFQDAAALAGDPDAELAFGLRSRGEGVTWILPPRLEEALERSPGLDTRLHGLPVGMFSAGEVRRVGDPLYGDLRRLGELVNAEVALLPVRAWVHPGEDGPRVRLSAAILHVRTGRVLWFGVAEGRPGEAADPAALASAVESLARTLLWYATGTGTTTPGA